MDNILDHVVVQGQRYDIVSPTAFGEYIETIGSACINPDGYAKGSTFLAKLGNEQFYYEATAAITQGSAILEGTNCKKTTVTGREAELASEIETLGETVDSLNEAFANQSFANGAVNLLPNKATSQVINGLTFEVNPTGYPQGSVKVSGLSTAETTLRLDLSPIEAGNYRLSGCPENGSNDTYSLKYYYRVNSWTAISDVGNGIPINLSGTINENYVGINIKNNVAISTPIIFKPMITLADMPNSDYAHYVPYAKSNKEITDAIASKEGTLSVSSIVSANYLEIRQFGKVVTVNGYLTLNGNQIADGVTANDLGTVSGVDFPSIYKNVRTLCGIATNPWEKPTEVGYIVFSSGGDLQMKLSSSGVKNVYFSFSYVVA